MNPGTGVKGNSKRLRLQRTDRQGPRKFRGGFSSETVLDRLGKIDRSSCLVIRTVPQHAAAKCCTMSLPVIAAIRMLSLRCLCRTLYSPQPSPMILAGPDYGQPRPSSTAPGNPVRSPYL